MEREDMTMILLIMSNIDYFLFEFIAISGP